MSVVQQYYGRYLLFLNNFPIVVFDATSIVRVVLRILHSFVPAIGKILSIIIIVEKEVAVHRTSICIVLYLKPLCL